MDKKQLKEFLQGIDESTTIKDVDLKGAAVYCVNDEKDDHLVVDACNCDLEVIPRQGKLYKDQWTEAELKNILEVGFFIKDDYNKSLLLSQGAVEKLKAKLNLGSGLEGYEVGRLFAARLRDIGKARLVLRSYGLGEPHIIAIMRERYEYVPQSIIGDLVDNIEAKLGNLDIINVYSNDDITEVELTVKNITANLANKYAFGKDIEARLRIGTSDTGQASLFVEGLLNVNGKNCRFETVRHVHKHLTDSELKAFVKTVGSKVIANIYELPERLVELQSLKVTDKSKTEMENKNAIENCIEFMLSKSKISSKISQTFVLGKKCRNVRQGGGLKDKLIEAFNPTQKLTAYDIVWTTMEVLKDNVVDMSRNKKRVLEEIAYKIPFFDYESKEEDSDL